jgi:hypothetical protein
MSNIINSEYEEVQNLVKNLNDDVLHLVMQYIQPSIEKGFLVTIYNHLKKKEEIYNYESYFCQEIEKYYEYFLAVPPIVKINDRAFKVRCVSVNGCGVVIPYKKWEDSKTYFQLLTDIKDYYKLGYFSKTIESPLKDLISKGIGFDTCIRTCKDLLIEVYEKDLTKYKDLKPYNRYLFMNGNVIKKTFNLSYKTAEPSSPMTDFNQYLQGLEELLKSFRDNAMRGRKIAKETALMIKEMDHIADKAYLQQSPVKLIKTAINNFKMKGIIDTNLLNDLKELLSYRELLKDCIESLTHVVPSVMGAVYNNYGIEIFNTRENLIKIIKRDNKFDCEISLYDTESITEEEINAVVKVEFSTASFYNSFTYTLKKDESHSSRWISLVRSI